MLGALRELIAEADDFTRSCRTPPVGGQIFEPQEFARQIVGNFGGRQDVV